MMKILLIGGDNGGGSAGDELMCEAACWYFKTNCPNFELYVDAHSEDWEPPYEGINVIKQLRKDDYKNKLERLYKLCLKLYRILTFPFLSSLNSKVPFYLHGNEFKEIIKKVDVVLFTGCGGLTDKYPINVINWASIVYAAKRHKKKVYISGSGIGPLENTFLKLLVKKIINKVDYVTVRDFNYSLDFLNIYSKNSNFEWVPDDAFFYYSKSPYGVQLDDKEILGVNVMSSLFNSKEELNIFADNIRQLSNLMSLKIYFLAVTHEDYNVLNYLKQQISGSILIPKLNPSDTKYVISKFKYFLTARYHGCVFAASQSIPTVSFYKEEYWKSKNTGVFSMVGINTNVVHIEKGLICNNFKYIFQLLTAKNNIYNSKIFEKLEPKSFFGSQNDKK